MKSDASKRAILAGLAVVGVLVAGFLVLRSDEPTGKGGPTVSPGDPKPGKGPTRVDPIATDPAGGTKADPSETTQGQTPTPAPTGPDQRFDPPPPPDPGVPVRGRVQSAEGAPIAGATISAGQVLSGVRGWELARTDAQGRFSISSRELPPSQLLEVAAKGWATRMTPVVLEDPVNGVRPTPDELVVILLPCRTLAGRVVAAEDGRGIAEATVTAESATWRGWIDTGADGRFAFADVPQGEEANLSARAAGRVTALASTPEQGELVIELSRGAAVRGQVVDDQGRGCEAAVWVVAAGQLASPQSVRSDAAGKFEAWGVDEGDEVLVLAETRAAATPFTNAWAVPSGEVKVALAARARLTLLRVPAGEVVLRAADCPAPIPGAVRELGRGGARPRLALDHLAAGRWQVELDGEPRGEPIELAPGASLEVDLAALLAGSPLPPKPQQSENGPCEVRARVTDELGRPLAHVEVSVSGAAHARARQSGLDGVAVIGELPLGPVTVSAFLPGRVLVAPAYLEPTPGVAEEITLVLSAPVAVRGRILPPQAGEVRAFLADETPLASVRADGDGSFRLGGLPAVAIRLQVVVPECFVKELELDLTKPQGELSVTVERDPGHGVPPGETPR